MELFTLQALWAVLAIILIDIVLAGDNALVIGMAANKLPPELRKRAIFWGTFGAVAIRFISVAALTYLLMIPGLRLVGALALIYIGWRLVFDQHTDESVESKTTLRGAITTIIVADAVMGIDNALGIAAAANGEFGLVIFGLLISVPIILFGSSVVSKILARWPDVVFAGSFVLFVVAFQMLFKEPLLSTWLAPLPGWVLTSLPWTGGFTIMAVQFAQARLHLVKRYLFKK
jgi:YjbE family integral membrane protein